MALVQITNNEGNAVSVKQITAQVLGKNKVDEQDRKYVIK